ncbi:MAG: histidine--tRNA ligase, partial [Eggerthellaceae bacterium]|nr:histidine--tRNA ligase [Eggerthellaceae bacterium]
MPYTTPEGTNDLLASQARLWQKAQFVAKQVFETYGYELIETPKFEITEVFSRGIGEATDVVGKEMFVVRSGANYQKACEQGSDEALKLKQKLSLRPEGTAGVVRAAIQHNLVPQGAAPAKLYYMGPMFRSERPQRGRLREFHQIGAECLGSTEATADVEMILMLLRFYEEMGIKRENLRVLVNSMGDDACRPAYRERVRDFLLQHSDDLCDDCNRRADTNPLRAFDCKNPGCKHVMSEAPKITDYLCEACAHHHREVIDLLANAHVDVVEDFSLVRGLDYYTRTVFEIQSTEIEAANSALGGGGRYDNLSESLGGKPMTGLGFALGFERVAIALEDSGVELPLADNLDVYVACATRDVAHQAFSLLQDVRNAGLSAEMDHQGKSLKSQFKIADKLQSRFAIIVGPDELAQGNVTIRN